MGIDRTGSANHVQHQHAASIGNGSGQSGAPAAQSNGSKLGDNSISRSSQQAPQQGQTSSGKSSSNEALMDHIKRIVGDLNDNDTIEDMQRRL